MLGVPCTNCSPLNRLRRFSELTEKEKEDVLKKEGVLTGNKAQCSVTLATSMFCQALSSSKPGHSCGAHEGHDATSSSEQREQGVVRLSMFEVESSASSTAVDRGSVAVCCVCVFAQAKGINALDLALPSGSKWPFE